MIFQNWLNYLSTLLISGRLNAKEVNDDVDFGQLCPCLNRNSGKFFRVYYKEVKSNFVKDGYVPAEEENAKILKMYGEENTDNLMKLPNSRIITTDQTLFTFFTR